MSAGGSILDRARLVVRTVDGGPHERAVGGQGLVDVGPLSVELGETAGGWTWSATPAGRGSVSVTSVALEWDVGDPGEDPRMFCNGYQSWSSSRVRRLGVDLDPSNVAPVASLVREMHHADPAVSSEGELRSEMVTVLGLGGPFVLVGFLGGADHDGTIRARLEGGRVVVSAEAYLGGAVCRPGEVRRLHEVTVAEGDDAPSLLAAWGARAGTEAGARTSAPFQVGWCSWYQWFFTVTERVVAENLALAADWPFEVFQVDDGYQYAIGDWERTDGSFPSGIESVASGIAAAGRTPGLWLAPFLAAPTSDLAGAHPEWVVRHASGRPLVGMVNPQWGGEVHVLDTTEPEVLDHLEQTAGALVAAGYPYLKLDFTYAPSIAGRYADATRTPAQRVRAGMDALRRGAGDDAFLLGCGLPLGTGIGVVDGMRIGADVAPHWELRPGQYAPGGYGDTEPATGNAFRNTLTRSWMHRRLWLNDPDCLMLRTSETGLTDDEVRGWALTVAASGGMAIVSDDLSLLDTGARSLLDEVLATGRAVDAAAASGDAPTCPDLLGEDPPRTLTGAVRTLIVDLDPVAATLT